jgi:hypothetical protein
MEGGIRYFDFRCGWFKGAWHTFHFEIGNTCETLLQNISQFIHEHPREVVILEMSAFEGSPSAQNIADLEDFVISQLGPHLYPVDYAFSRTLKDLVSTGQTALVTMDSRSGRYNDVIWDSFTTIYNTYADSDKLNKMHDYDQARIKEYLAGAQASKLYKISYTLTPSADVILEAPIPFTPNSLKELADTANGQLVYFYKTLRSEGLVPWGNIVIVDHFQSCPYLDVVLDMNGISSLD